MRGLRAGTTAWLIGSALLVSYSTHAQTASVQTASPQNINTQAAQANQSGHAGVRAALVSDTKLPRALYGTNKRIATRSYGISCVPYARQVSGIMVPGNAWQWWNNAGGRYARGDRPEPGSVLNFRANGRMQLGHVAVVNRIVNAREIIVDQANWPSGGNGGGRVSHNVSVVDVSEANNWSAVRVELARDGEFGSVYPTYGFIYNRPDTGQVLTSIVRPAPQSVINRIPSDLRPVAERPWRTVVEEVAEAPATPQRQTDPSTTRSGP